MISIHPSNVAYIELQNISSNFYYTFCELSVYVVMTAKPECRNATYHLKKSNKASKRIIEVDFWIPPFIVHWKAFGLIRHDRGGQFLAILINALVKSSTEKLNTHNAKDEPEYSTNEAYVENLWNDGE